MNQIWRLIRKRPDLGVIIFAVLLFVVFSIIDPKGWLAPFTQKNVIHFTAILGLMAMGQALVIMSREIDLSVGSVYGLIGITYISLEPALGVIGSFVASLLLAAAIGALNAFLVLRLRLVSMIVTLGALFFYRGVIYVVTGGSVDSFAKDARDHWFNRLLGGELFGIENAVFWCLLVAVILTVLLTGMRWGNRLLASGGDEPSALSQGVRVTRVKAGAFVASSLLAGFAAIVTLADQPQTHVTLGFEQELEAIAAAVIGGCLLTGGRGSAIGALLGAFVLTSVRYEMIALGAPSAWYITFVGALLLLAVIGNTALMRRVAA